MNSRVRMQWHAVALIILSLAACSPSPTAMETEQALTLPETNLFEQPDSSAGGRIGGYSAGPIGIDPFKGDTLTFTGEPIQVAFFLQGTGSDTEVGLILFLDGVVQPHRLIKTSQKEVSSESDQDLIMSKHRVSSDGRTELTVSFIPVTGRVGEVLGLTRLFLFEPSFAPETENQSFGIYQDGSPYLLAPVIMEKDAPQITEENVADVKTSPIPPSEKQANELNPSGRISQPQFLFYSGELLYPNKLVAENGQIDLTISIYGGIEADYRVTVFLNHQPINVVGHPDFIVRTYYDKISTYIFTLDVRGYSRLNSLYAVIVPMGQSYKDSDIYGRKIGSILLVNEAAERISPTIETSLPTGRNSTATPIPPVGDLDLTHWLTENALYPQYGQTGIHLVGDDRLLVWFDSAAQFDLRSGTLLSKTEITTGPSEQKVDFAENVVGVFTKDISCMECSVVLERYDAHLNLIGTLDLSQIMELRMDVLSPFQCALSHSGKTIACAKGETAQILLYDLHTKDQTVAFDFSKSSLSSFRGIDALAFAGNDSYLAFTAAESSGYGFGIVDLDGNRMVDYTHWDAVADEIQATDNAVYFHEQLKAPHIPRSGKIFKIDLDTLEKHVIQLVDEEESKYVTVSPTGKFIVTVTDTAEPGAAYMAGSIKVYDAQTMVLIRQINLERGFPRLVIDEANRCLFAFYLVDEDIKLFRYVF